jgi:hypothetical protein
MDCFLFPEHFRGLAIMETVGKKEAGAESRLVPSEQSYSGSHRGEGSKRKNIATSSEAKASFSCNVLKRHPRARAW